MSEQSSKFDYATNFPNNKNVKRDRSITSKKKIIEKMQEGDLKNLGLSNKLIDKILTVFFEEYKKAILSNDKVELLNLGIFKKDLIKGKLIRHPLTKNDSISPPHYRINFTPTKSLKDALRQKALEEIKKVTL